VRPSSKCNWGSISSTNRKGVINNHRHQAGPRARIHQSHQGLSENLSKPKSAWTVILQGRALLARRRWVKQVISLQKIRTKGHLTKARSLKIQSTSMPCRRELLMLSSHNSRRYKCMITPLNRKDAGFKLPHSDKIKYSTQAVTAWCRSCRCRYWGSSHQWSYDRVSDWNLLTTLIYLVISSITINAP